MSTPGKRVCFRILILAFSLLAGTGLTELAVYLKFRKTLSLFPRYVTGADYNGYRIRRNIPHARYRHRSYDGQWFFRINAQGFRNDDDFTYAKPAGTVRVLTLGDSFTMGYEVQQEETYSAVLERALRERGLPAQVLNAGVSGFSTAEELVYFEQEGIRYHPDFLILGFYGNDPDDNIRSDLYRLQNDQLSLNKKEYLPAVRERDFLNSFGFYRWLSEHSYLHNYLNTRATIFFKRQMVQRNLSALTTPPSTGGDPGLSPNDYPWRLTCRLLTRIYEVAAQHGVGFILLDIPDHSNLSDSIPHWCPTDGLCDDFVSGAEVLSRYQGPPPLYRPHGSFHWAPISHELIGNVLAARIEKLLRAPRPTPKSEPPGAPLDPPPTGRI